MFIIKWNNVSLTHSEYVNVGLLVIGQVFSLKPDITEDYFCPEKQLKLFLKHNCTMRSALQYRSCYIPLPQFICLFVCLLCCGNTCRTPIFVTASLNGKVG